MSKLNILKSIRKAPLLLVSLAAGVSLLTGAFFVRAESAATPAPVWHSESYSQEPDTNAVEGWPDGPLIEGSSAVLMDANTGAILYSKNPDQVLYPASITKIMTGFLACERLNMSDSYAMSYAAAYGIEAGSSSIYGDVDEVFTVEQQMMGLMLESANEMALALGEEVSGSVKKFVELMNLRARQLGCTNTHFNNPNGLPDPAHVTTASDMARIARAAWMNLTFRSFVTCESYQIPPTNVMKETRYLSNHHKMMPGRERAYDGVLGGKTGYTQAAGNTLVTYAKRDDLSLVCVVMNSVDGAYPDTAALLDYGFANFDYATVSIPMTRLNNLMPSQELLLNTGDDTCPFLTIRKGLVTVPNGTDVKKDLTDETAFVHCAVGPDLLVHTYSFNGHVVGTGQQYEQTILPVLVKDSLF